MIKLNYGQTEIAFELPQGNLLGILEGKKMPVASNVAAAVKTSLAAPIAAPPLNHFVKAGEKVVICVPDKTRQKIFSGNILNLLGME